MRPGLVLKSVTIAVDGRVLMENLDLAIAPGEVVTLMGQSGSGKSTLVNYIGGHLDRGFRASGSVHLGGRNITAMPAAERRVGLLFQDDLLFPHLSVLENLLFGLAASVRGRVARRELAVGELARAGLSGFEDRDPATLSGGQRARVALLRTLLARPDALLLDEPFGKLDPGLRSVFRTVVFDQTRQQGIPVLLVTHDGADAEAAGGRVVTLA